MLQLQLDNSISFHIYPYLQCEKEPCVKLLESTSYNKRLEELNCIIADRELLRSHQDDYYQKEEMKYKQMFEPLDNRLFKALQKRGYIPSFISKKRKLLALDLIQCESHRDRLIYHLLH